MGFSGAGFICIWVLGGDYLSLNPKKMIDSNEYPPEEKENTCGFCGEESDGEFCDSNCKKAYKSEN